MQPLDVKSKEGFWRDGRLLVMARGAKFPPRCLKTNFPVEREEFELTTFHYPPSFRILTILCPPFVIISELIGKEVSILTPVGEGWRAKRSFARILMVFLYALALSSLAGMCFFGGKLIWLLLLLGLSGGSIFAAAVVGLFLIPRVDLVAMSDSHYWFRGCSEELLAEYPDTASEAKFYR